jgi:hypothetical protein
LFTVEVWFPLFDVSFETSIHQNMAVNIVINIINEIIIIIIELNHHTKFIIVNIAAIDAIKGHGLISIICEV